MMVGSFSDCNNTAVSLVPSAEVMGLDAADLAAEFFLNMLGSCCLSDKSSEFVDFEGAKKCSVDCENRIHGGRYAPKKSTLLANAQTGKTENLAHHAPF